MDNRKKSNRYLAKRFNFLRRTSFCEYSEKYLQKLSCLKSVYYDIHVIEPTDSSYVYRAVINKNSFPVESIERIKYNPSPKCISRANLIGQGIGYYACAADISIIESCHEDLKSTDERYFDLTVSMWKIKKDIPVQIICHSKQAQCVGTDLIDYYIATSKCRRQKHPRKIYRTWFLKMKFIADQYAKIRVECEKDYYISGWHSKNVLKHPEIEGIVYPSIQYMYKGFNYAFSPDLFHNSSLELEEVFHYTVQFDCNDYKKYPNIKLLKSTRIFNDDNIIW